MPNECNIPSRTIFIGDNLDILRGINSDSVDLIYLDPPFNSNRMYAAPLDSKAKGAEFSDVWTMDDMKEEWVKEVEFKMPAVHRAINASKLMHSESMAGYLTFMSVRLIEMRRVMKRNASIYLHCDDSAVHYLKGIMDAIFGGGGTSATTSFGSAPHPTTTPSATGAFLTICSSTPTVLSPYGTAMRSASQRMMMSWKGRIRPKTRTGATEQKT